MSDKFYNSLINFIIKENNVCSLYCEGGSKTNNVNIKEIEKILTTSNTKYLPFEILSSLACGFDMIFDSVKLDNILPYQLNHSIIKWINNIKEIAQTSNSKVFLGDFLNNDFLIIKNVNDLSLFEYFIGT